VTRIWASLFGSQALEKENAGSLCDQRQLTYKCCVRTVRRKLEWLLASVLKEYEDFAAVAKSINKNALHIQLYLI
jgi:hypothetical protein